MDPLKISLKNLTENLTGNLTKQLENLTEKLTRNLTGHLTEHPLHSLTQFVTGKCQLPAAIRQLPTGRLTITSCQLPAGLDYGSVQRNLSLSSGRDQGQCGCCVMVCSLYTKCAISYFFVYVFVLFFTPISLCQFLLWRASIEQNDELSKRRNACIWSHTPIPRLIFSLPLAAAANHYNL